MLCLVARYNEQSVHFPLPTTRSRVGSSANNELVIPFPGVSRLHALLEPSGQTLRLTDAGSRNGIFVDGTRVEEVTLGPTVRVQIGRALLAIENSSTSDVMPAEGSRRGPKIIRPDASAETASPHEARRGSPEAALRFIREAAHFGERLTNRRRTWLLQESRKILAPETIALVSRADDGEDVILAVEGSLPNRTFGSKSSARTKELSIQSHILDGKRTTVAVRGKLAVIAVWPASAPRPAWQEDLLAFVAQILLAPNASRPNLAERASDHAGLVLPTGMVLGDSESMRKLFNQIEATIKSKMDVLLIGETGTGKELFARMIHESGTVPKNDLFPINCAAIPSELLESMLFGVQGRVATGVDPRQGLFVKANGGSILLDEIAELPEPLQAKLLRVLQEREVLAVGATTPQKINVRIISASNRNLFDLVQEGRFRADLFYRLRKLQFHIPPLRERREDIPPLAFAFVHRAAEEHGKDIQGITSRALALMREHDWPGNVRELETEIRRAVLNCPSGGTIRSEHFDTGRWQSAPAARAAETPITEPAVLNDSDDNPRSRPQTLRARMEEVERAAIQDALALTGGNQSKAARLLKITRNGLAQKLARLGIAKK